MYSGRNAPKIRKNLLSPSSELTMEGSVFTETSVNLYPTTWYHIPDSKILQERNTRTRNQPMPHYTQFGIPGINSLNVSAKKIIQKSVWNVIQSQKSQHMYQNKILR